MALIRLAKTSPAVRNGLAISAATGIYGISFGALGIAAGLDVMQTCALSLLMFTGGSQFAMIGVIGGGGTPTAAFGAATMLGIRNGVYGMQVKAMLRPTGWRRLLAAQLTIDESAATALSATDPAEQRRGFWTAGLGIYLLWNTTTLIGAIVGNAIGDPKIWGLDGAAVAAFLGLLWPRLKGAQPWATAIICVIVTAATVPLLPSGVPILLAGVIAAIIGLTMRPTPTATTTTAGGTR